ncbi:MAG TPA: hypothetical protein VFC80_05630 [Sphaerochaeta sp.]|nr:hypothetical protein [Sphaerochaeta sp.]
MAKTKGLGHLQLLEMQQRDSILFGLYARGGEFKKAIDEEVKKRLSLITAEDVARDVIGALRVVDDEMAYNKSGRGPWGYRSYEETVSELIRDQFDPFLATIKNAAKEKRIDLALIRTEGIILGLYHYERNCPYNYIDAVPDDWIMMAEEAMETWQDLRPDDETLQQQLTAFIAKNCPQWKLIFE